MQNYIVNIYCREVWEVKAETEEEAKKLALGGKGRMTTTVDTGKVVVREYLGEFK